MDSEHRHELEENLLAKKLAEAYEDVKPRLPAYGVGLVAILAGIIGLNGWRASTAQAEAERWKDFAVAVEGAQPNEDLLRQAMEQNPGTPVAEWAEVTWADGKLFDAAGRYFRDRKTANEYLDEAIAVYERLVKSDDLSISERATFQLGRALELKGELEQAREQYALVTGGFAAVAQARAEQLDSPKVQKAYEWITATKTAQAAATTPTGLEDFEPDDIEMPEVTAADAEATLQDLLDTVEEEVNAAEQAEEEAAEDSLENLIEEATEEPAAETPAEE